MVEEEVDKIISPLIAAQFPDFYQTDGPNFIAFVQAYYEWMEQANTQQYRGSVVTESRNLLDYIDVDRTADQFIKYFKDMYLNSMPDTMAVDKRFLVKHVLDLYRTKGTERAYKLLFRILYNDDIDLFIPNERVFKLSNANWRTPRYIETTDSPFLSQLAGRFIRSSSGATAVVESFNQTIVKGKTVNVLYLSRLLGQFKFNELVFCDDIPAMVGNSAPVIIGSLSAISVDSGGSEFKIGDELGVAGTGAGGVARVAAVRSENGKVSFDLVDGGFGFTTNAVITVDSTNTGGTGATFSIGGIVDQEIISLNTDIISGGVSAVLDLSSSGLHVSMTTSNGVFLNGELAAGTALSRHINTTVLSQPALPLANGELLSNTALGIAVVVYHSDGDDLYLTGNTAVLNNANLAIDTALISNATNVIVQVTRLTPVSTITANGVVVASGSNSTFLSVVRNDAADIGYYIPGMVITGNTSGAIATVISATRLTDWQYFPGSIGASNIDTILGNALSYSLKEIGKISFINHENPGTGYATAPTVSIVEPLVYDLAIPDGFGKFLGFNAVVTANAGNANGIVTAVSMIDSGLSYTTDEFLTLSNANNATAVFGRALINTQGVGRGYWTDRQSFISDIMRLHDGYYYQTFSYEIVAEKMIGVYRKFVKELVHPVGHELFGRFAVKRELDNSSFVASSNVVQTVP